MKFLASLECSSAQRGVRSLLFCQLDPWLVDEGEEGPNTASVQHTMCDFHNFGLLFAGQMHCLPQRLNSTLFEIFLNGGCLKGTRSVEKISNNVDFSL